MTQRYVWSIYCPLEAQYVGVISATQPTVCPNDSTPVDPNKTRIMESEFYEVISRGYVSIESQLADNRAIQINASDTNGGIDVQAGVGGIAVDTTNSISLDAGAASNFTTSNGNLELEATAGLVNIDGGTAVNVGTTSLTPQIMVGSDANPKNIFIGNNTGATALTLRSGTGKITLNSAATGTDAITVFSSDGIDVDAAGVINLSSANNTLGAVTLDASFAGGGVLLVSGAQGIYLSSNGGPLAFGSFSGGDVYLGTAAIARVINIGNTTGTTAVVIQSGTGGIAIGNDTSTGGIELGNVASAKTVIMGNNSANSRQFLRYGTGGIIRSQEPHTALADADATLTIAQLLSVIFEITPTVDRTLTLPTAAAAVAGISGVIVGDSVDFTIINNSTPTNEASVILAMGTGGTMVGNNIVSSYTNITGSYFTSGSSIFRLRFTNVGAGTEAYTVYRIA